VPLAAVEPPEPAVIVRPPEPPSRPVLLVE
jgi:hypothetical protein